ncbi:MAG: Gfo/Idh/MocA family oxidoreductase [Cyclobacteriaceae bacterium]|nr:Gfo/Idh/MocA family oxidoreductase [Cyclobacteriaceae bacterium HetDA_MAG_MS6]
MTSKSDQYRYEGEPLKVGIAGLVHGHVGWILGREPIGDIEIVGIAEPNTELAKKLSKEFGFPMDIVYSSLPEMLDKVKPEAVTAFNNTYDHLSLVEQCAPRGIHVMVEKPLAVNLEHAEKMEQLAKKHEIHLLTNYETTWYGSNKKAYDIALKEKKAEDIRRIVFKTGHPGPKEIGCSPEFLAWLTDPVLNGGGALTDFGCYGANLATWLLGGEPPQTISCNTQQIKPDVYPKVEDEATIVLTYPKAQVIIQASWNWSHHLKEMELYGKDWYVLCKDKQDMLVKDAESKPRMIKAAALDNGVHDPFAYLTSVVKEDLQVKPSDLSSLENNMIVMKILEGAKRSAATGQVLDWKSISAQ